MDDDAVGVPSSYLVVVDRLARIEVKLDEALKTRTDHENRLRLLERWKYTLPAALLTSVISGVVGLYGVLGR